MWLEHQVIYVSHVLLPVWFLHIPATKRSFPQPHGEAGRGGVRNEAGGAGLCPQPAWAPWGLGWGAPWFPQNPSLRPGRARLARSLRLRRAGWGRGRMPTTL